MIPNIRLLANNRKGLLYIMVRHTLSSQSEINNKHPIRALIQKSVPETFLIVFL